MRNPTFKYQGEEYEVTERPHMFISSREYCFHAKKIEKQPTVVKGDVIKFDFSDTYRLVTASDGIRGGLLSLNKGNLSDNGWFFDAGDITHIYRDGELLWERK